MPSTRSSLRMLLTSMLLVIGAVCESTAAAQSPATPTATKPKPIAYVAPSRATYLKFADETETMLRRDVLGVWFPRTVDHAHGGFSSDFARDWQPPKSEGKFSVFQGRMTWIASQIVMRRPDLKEQYLPIVQHGVDFLSNVLWDKQYGGFFWGVDDNG